MLGIIILNYKSWNLVIDCINSIKDNCKLQHYHIYIVDNGSENESLEKLYEIYGNNHKCTIIDAKINRGFAYGNNLGAKRAIDDGCSKLLITNSDIIFLDDAIDKLCAVMDKGNDSYYEQFSTVKKKSDDKNCQLNNPFLVYPIVYNRDKTLQLRECFIGQRDKFYDIILNNNVLIKLVPKNIFYKYFSDINNLLKSKKSSEENLIKTNMFFGCCFLVDSKKFKEIEMLDEETFLYYEENILSTKALNKGFEMFLSLDSSVIHLQGASSDKSKTKWFEYVSKVYYLREYKKISKLFIKFDMVINEIFSYLKCRRLLDFKNNSKNISEAKRKIKKYL